MNRDALDIVVFGLSLSSSWGNGHATTWRALLRGLAAQGHRLLFLEEDQPWYAPHRDLTEPDFCDFALYPDHATALARHAARLRGADAVIVGSYVPEGIALIDRLAALRPRRLAFYDIDTPVTLEALAGGSCRYLARRQIPLFDVYFSFSGGRALELLEGSFGARRARALYCTVDPDRHLPRAAPAPPRWDLGYLGTYSPDRQPGLERLLLEPARLLPAQRFVVAGPGYPDGLDWPANVERIDHLGPGDHADFYGAQRFTLNLTRAAMRRMGWSPSVRLFEAAACGTPVISDRWEGLGTLFPDPAAIRIADCTQDVCAILSGASEAERAAIARAARAIVLARHGADTRAAELAAELRALSPRAAPIPDPLPSEGTAR